jgi:xylan 1,4-beta-xylosidase
VGATPFFALSYMPPAIAQTDIVSFPKSWNDWSLVVQKTIERYSGEKRIPDVYYEVWNEPDLFGSMKAGSYMTLYRASSVGAKRASGVLPFKFGGPATTGLYKNWVDLLLKVAEEERLRLDFISWHRYDTDPQRHIQDIIEVEGWIGQRPYFADLEVIVTEWGPYSDNNSMYDGISGAAHLLTVIRHQMGRINMAMLFSIKDGKDPSGQAFWGRWGLFTSDATGNKPKPRYTALVWLNSLGEERLNISGEGSWVNGIAARKGNTYQLILVNYDLQGKHSEAVPVKFTGLANGTYTYKEKYLSGGNKTLDVNASLGEVSQTVFLKANDSAFVELIPK